jgi:hypothetical protein
MIRVKAPQDFWAGVLFASIGGAALWFGRDYRFGTIMAMGPGYLPAVLGWALVAIGAFLCVRSLAVTGPPIAASDYRPQACILAAIVIFALLIERVGLAPSVVVITMTAALASREMRWLEAVILGVVMAAATVVLFITILGQPIAAVALPWMF